MVLCRFMVCGAPWIKCDITRHHMAQLNPAVDEITVKAAIVGQPLSGKKNIIEQVAARYEQSAMKSQLVSEAEIIRTEFIWPEPLPNGPFIRVKLLALSGKPVHRAAEQLLLSDCDALVFVVNCNPTLISESQASLASLMANARFTGLNWGDIKLVLQYNNAESYPHVKPGDLDAWLGVNTEQVERYHTQSDLNEHHGLAVDAAIRGAIAQMTPREHIEPGLPA